MRELISVTEAGHEAICLFVIQRGDCALFAPSWEKDATYSGLLAQVSYVYNEWWSECLLSLHPGTLETFLHPHPNTYCTGGSMTPAHTSYVHTQASEQGVKMLAIKCEHCVDIKGKAAVHFTGTTDIDLGYRALQQKAAMGVGTNSKQSKTRKRPRQK